MRDAGVGIVVLTYNRRTEVLRTLRHLTAPGHGQPIVVVDNASSDDTTSAIRTAFSGIEVIRLPRNVGAAGRNVGVRAIGTPYVAFCDDDTWWQPGALARAAAVLDAHPDLAVVTARVLVGEAGRDDPASERMSASPFANTAGVPGTAVLGFLAGACMMRRAAFLQAGGYHPRFFLGAEEALLAIDLMAAGWHMAYAPEVLVRHHPSRLRDVAQRRRLLLRNALWCAWLRRPWRSALAETARRLREARRAGLLASTACAALGGVAWIARERRVIPARVEGALRALDAFERSVRQ